MATIRLTPSAYTLSSTSYLSVSNASNMYDDTDSPTCATVTNSRTGTSSYYLYLSGFNFGDIPGGAVVSSFSVKLKACGSGVSTSSQYAPVVMNSAGDPGGAPPGGAGGSLGTFSSLTASAQTLTASMSADWETVCAAGSGLSIQINCRRASRNTTAYVYIYGAEIEVEYTVPEPCTITSTLTGDGTISPHGAYSTYEGAEYTLTITPADTSDTVTAAKDGVDITASLTAHGAAATVHTVLGAYALESGGFSGAGASYFEGLVGCGADASQTTGNYYSSGSGTTAVFAYSMAFPDIPGSAVIERVYCQVSGHAESASNSSEYMCVQLKSGGAALSEQVNFKQTGTSNTTITLECTTLPTAAQLAGLALECTLGYYGGAINGATCYVVYSIPSEHPSYYTYTCTADGDAAIAVVIGGASEKLFFRSGEVWTAAAAAYKKTGGAWVRQNDLTTVFDGNTNYVRGTDT